ncbi:MAG: 30S ribosomal protein S18 [Chloroflexi bacterium]|nr:30S ribosomal protein S18 [Chloroflexota bacterium]
MVRERTTTNRPRGKRDEKGRYIPKRKVCPFCKDKIAVIDYKDPGKLGQFVSGRGKIEPRRRTGTCAKHQRALAVAIKRARHLAMLPFAPVHIYQTGVLPGAQRE